MRIGYRIQYFFTLLIEFPKKIYDITLLCIYYLILQVVNETCDCSITLDEDIHVVWALLDKIICSFYFVSVVH